MYRAAVFGVMDAAAQGVGASEDDTIAALRIFASQFSNSDTVLREIFVCGTMPEMQPVVIAAGSAVFDVLRGDSLSRQMVLLVNTLAEFWPNRRAQRAA